MIIEVPLTVQSTIFWPLELTGPNPMGRVCACEMNGALGTVFAIFGVTIAFPQPTGGLGQAVVVGLATV